MLHDSSPQSNSNDPINPNQAPVDTTDERFVAKLQALYVAPEVPQRLRKSGAEQVRLQLATSTRSHARHDVFRILRCMPTSSATMQSISTRRFSALPGARQNERSRLEGSSRLTGATAVAAVALVSLLAVALFAWPAPFRHGMMMWPAPIAGHGQHTPAATAALADPHIVLSSIAMVSANDGWAFGAEWFPPISTTPATPAKIRTTCLVLHYNGVAWSRHLGSACVEATGISMLSASEGWAVGYNTILHYTRGDWRVDTSNALPDQTGRLVRVAMVSSDEGWAVGTVDAHALILHYAHGQWTPAKVAGIAGDSVGGLRGISMVSAQEGWAVGSELSNSRETTLVLHYIKGQWTRIAWSMPGSFNSVAALPSGDVWVAGEDNIMAGPGLVVHLWQGIPIQQYRPTSALLESIAMVSPGEGWAVGDGAATVRYHNGEWTREGLTIHHFALTGVSLVSATEGWAVGNATESGSTPPVDSNENARLFHLSGGTWQIYSLLGV